MIMSALPIIIMVISYIIWFLTYKCGFIQKEDVETKFKASTIFLLFLVHPSMTKGMIDMFNCQYVDNTKRLSSNMQTICYEGFHGKLVNYVCYPCLVIWGFGIPAAVYILMSKYQDRLD
jgi:hypothetical protein